MNKDLFKILDNVGLIDEDRELFDKQTSDLVSTMNLVDSIMTNNDETTIKKFLTVLLYKYHDGE